MLAGPIAGCPTSYGEAADATYGAAGIVTAAGAARMTGVTADAGDPAVADETMKRSCVSVCAYSGRLVCLHTLVWSVGNLCVGLHKLVRWSLSEQARVVVFCTSSNGNCLRMPRVCGCMRYD